MIQAARDGFGPDGAPPPLTPTSVRMRSHAAAESARSLGFHLASILLAVAFLAAPRFAIAQDPAPPLFQRIVLLGASATSGFEPSEPFGGPKTGQFLFAHYVEAALIGMHEPVATQASALLFLQAAEIMERQVAATVAAKPTLVIGLDTMFWFCYGAGMNAQQRAARFEAGLRLLERIDAPLVVGDIPDATKAAGGILRKEELPDSTTIARCNDRLKAWAAGRKGVTVFPLASMMARAAANEEVTLAGKTWEKGKSGALIRGDHLHPSRPALAALAIAMLDAAGPSLALVRDVEKVSAAGFARGTGK